MTDSATAFNSEELPNRDQQVTISTGGLSVGLYIVTVVVDGRSMQARLSIRR